MLPLLHSRAPPLRVMIIGTNTWRKMPHLLLRRLHRLLPRARYCRDTYDGRLGNSLPQGKGLAGYAEAAIEGSNPINMYMQGTHNPLAMPGPNLPAAARSAGLIDNPALAPQSAIERFAQAGATGIGAAGPMLALGGPIVPTLMAGAGGGYGAEAGRELFPGSTAAPMVGSLLGGLPLGNVGSAAEQGINSLLHNYNPSGVLFDEAGLPMRSAALTSASPATRATLGPYAPVAATQQDIGNAVEQQAAKLGTSRTLQQAGSALQDSARTWITNILPAKENAAWAPVDAVIPPATSTPLNNFMSILQQQTSKGGQLNAALAPLESHLPKTMLDALQNKTPIGLGVPPTWEEARALRSAVGDALRDPSIAKGAAEQNLRQMYAGITTDLRGVAQGIDATNPQAGATAAFDAANLESTRLHGFAENVLGKVIQSKNPQQVGITPENAANAMLAPAKKGGTMLGQLRNELPDAADELAAAHIRMKGLSDPTDPASPVSGAFSSQWGAMSPEAKLALVPDPSMRQILDANAGVAGALKGLGNGTPPGGMHSLVGGGAGAAVALLGDYALHRAIGTEPGSASEWAAGAGGELLGMAIPRGQAMARRAAANSPLIARYAAGAAPSFPLGRAQLPAASLANLLALPAIPPQQ